MAVAVAVGVEVVVGVVVGVGVLEAVGVSVGVCVAVDVAVGPASILKLDAPALPTVSWAYAAYVAAALFG